jgi:DNA polymerase
MKTEPGSDSGTSRDARPFLPAGPHPSIAQHRRAVQSCRGCELYKNATQAVFGEGNPHARIMLIGEQPGDQEDLQGHPFVGPAGKILDRALEEIGLDRASLFVTNAVKHFKWTPAPRGKRRLHAKPGAREIHACYPWLEREISLVKPSVIVCMGVTAGQAIFGRQFRLGESRGRVLQDPRWLSRTVATAHPSAILRMPDHESREREYKSFVTDLRLAKKAAGSVVKGVKAAV